ncbi:DNA gyrase inhibitor YacG [Novipirellula artificiosorum]|nr:DNA gyrase inhibitor YacG [Novipirellula artificiosorum]
MNSKLNCPSCGTRFFSDETDAMPFCCQRCRLIDLGRWLDEEIGMPFEGEPGDVPVEHRNGDPEARADD